MAASDYVGWPHKLTPIEFGVKIADEPKRSERMVLIACVPPGWLYHVRNAFELAVAQRIVAMPSKEDRIAALEQVPEDWVEDVRARVKSYWNSAYAPAGQR